MKLEAYIGDERHEIEIKRDGANVIAMVDEREYTLEVSEPESDVFLIKDDGHIREVSVSPAQAGTLRTRAGAAEIDIRIADPRRLRGAGPASEHAGGSAEIKTAMPGKVVRILKSEGDSVSSGEGVVVVEAMKMQNELKSPKDGAVSTVRVVEGDTVAAGDILLIID